MKYPFLAQVILTCLVFLGPSAQAEPRWKSIIPLQSTRADVERVLGSPTGDCRCLYSVSDATIYVEYAVAPCKGTLPGWNVPKETVLRFTVHPKAAQTLSVLNLNLAAFKVRQDDTFTRHYSNHEEGVEYSVSFEGLITSITYGPSIKNKDLRCSGFPMGDSSTANYVAFDKFGDVSPESEAARLDTFAVILSESTSLNGYVIAYAGRIACAGEGLLRATRARDYLINRRGIASARVKAIDGGYREEVTVELYALPIGVEPPAIAPTLSRSQIRLIRSNFRCERLRRGRD